MKQTASWKLHTVVQKFNLKDTNKALISKAVFVTSCKRGQKFQLICAY